MTLSRPPTSFGWTIVESVHKGTYELSYVQLISLYHGISRMEYRQDCTFVLQTHPANQVPCFSKNIFSPCHSLSPAIIVACFQHVYYFKEPGLFYRSPLQAPPHTHPSSAPYESSINTYLAINQVIADIYFRVFHGVQFWK